MVIRGRVGHLGIYDHLRYYHENSMLQRRYALWNKTFYSAGDWALDISEASVKGLAIYGVPSCLIRRDRDTQVVVRREKVATLDWRGLDIPAEFRIVFESVLTTGTEETILVAPVHRRRSQEFIEGIQSLRAAGIAEPD